MREKMNNNNNDLKDVSDSEEASFGYINAYIRTFNNFFWLNHIFAKKIIIFSFRFIIFLSHENEMFEIIFRQQ